MLEIYSEITRHLLTKDKQKEGLMVREDPKIGFYRNSKLELNI